MDARVQAVVDREQQERSGMGGACCEMPRYQSHKIVHALKIAEVLDPREPGNETDGSRIIVPADEGFAPFRVDHEYVRKHNPQAGGYYVTYDDGYKSWSPAKAFEDGYTRMEVNRYRRFSFGQALLALKSGKSVGRHGWNGKGMWLRLQIPDAGSKMGLPYIYLSTVDGQLVPWNPNNIDMLAEDWETI